MTCIICDGKHVARGWCRKHFQRWYRTGSPEGLRTGLTYGGAHHRVRRERGKATEHQCECGSQAFEWSYDHSDREELHGIVGNYTLAYSTDVSRYIARCVPCHRIYDHEKAHAS